MPGLNVTIGGDTSHLSSALQGADKLVHRFAGKISATLGEVAKVNIYEKLIEGAKELLGSPLEGIKEAFSLGGSLSDLQTRTGIAVKDLAVWQQAFKDNGMAAEDVGPKINKLQKALSGVNEEGGDTSSIFNRLGLDPQKLAGMKSASAQLAAVQKAINGLEDPAARASAAMQIFGKSGGQMLTLFGDSEALGKAAENLGAQAEILDRDAGMFDRISDILDASGNKLRGFFVGIADTVGPVLLPILERFNKLDFAKWGQQIGQAIAIFAQAFKDGTLSDLVGSGLKLGAMQGVNFLDHVLRGVVHALPEYFSALIELIGDDFKLLMTPAFWSGLVNVLAGAATKFGAYFLDVLGTPIVALQSAFQYVAEKLRNWLIDAFNGPIAFLRGGMNFVLQELMNGLLKIPGMKKLLGIEEAHKSWKEFQDEAKQTSSAADSQKTAPNLAAIYADRQKDGASFFGQKSSELRQMGDAELAKGGQDLLPLLQSRLARLQAEASKIGKSFKQGFGGKDLFDTSAERKRLSAQIAQLTARAAQAHDQATTSGNESKLDGLPKELGTKEKGSVVASSLAKIGGGGNFAGGTLGLQREANSLLRKIAANTGLKTGGLKTGSLQTNTLATFG